jgi:hypothetical protein
MASSSGTHINFEFYVDKVTHVAATNSLTVIYVAPLPATNSLGALCGSIPLNKNKGKCQFILMESSCIA